MPIISYLNTIDLAIVGRWYVKILHSIGLFFVNFFKNMGSYFDNGSTNVGLQMLSSLWFVGSPTENIGSALYNFFSTSTYFVNGNT